MSIKKIPELTQISSANDNDLLVVEALEGTVSVTKGDLFSEVDKILFTDVSTGKRYYLQIKNRQIIINPEPTIEEILIDFTYNANADGSYTLTGWKGTYNGITSTKCIIPAVNKTIYI